MTAEIQYVADTAWRVHTCGISAEARGMFVMHMYSHYLYLYAGKYALPIRHEQLAYAPNVPSQP